MTPVQSRRLFSALLAIVIAGVSFVSIADASADTLAPSPNGYGTASISGYVVSKIEYHMGQDPARIRFVAFTLDAPALSVKIRLSDSQTEWTDCVNVGSNDWVCDARNIQVAAANQLQVTARGK